MSTEAMLIVLRRIAAGNPKHKNFAQLAIAEARSAISVSQADELTHTDAQVTEKLERFGAIRDAQVGQLKAALIECSYELQLLNTAHPGPKHRGRRAEIAIALYRAARILGML